jgi:hypothetical protein
MAHWVGDYDAQGQEDDSLLQPVEADWPADSHLPCLELQ